MAHGAGRAAQVFISYALTARLTRTGLGFVGVPAEQTGLMHGCSVASGVVALPACTMRPRDAHFMLVIASPAYKRRNEGDAAVDDPGGALYRP